MLPSAGVDERDARLFQGLAEKVEILPRFDNAPSSLGIFSGASSPPRPPRLRADILSSFRDLSGNGTPQGETVDEGMDIAIFGSSLVSAYRNRAAIYFRGIIRQLHRSGHRVTFYEPDILDRQKHRDVDAPATLERLMSIPRREVLVARNGREVEALLRGLDRRRAGVIGANARLRTLAGHTYAHRARRLEAILGSRVSVPVEESYLR